MPSQRRADPIRMLCKIAEAARGGIVLLALGLNTVLLTLVLLACSLAKLLAPSESARSRVRKFLARLPVAWIAINNGIFAIMRITEWDIEIPENLNRDGCYLVLSNHQSWADVLILQRSFNRRLPFFRFFVKRSLIWLPFLGAAWWALDMPFMQRYSREQLERKPELKGRDLENAREACEKFSRIPVTMMNFPEGTRFSAAKRDHRNSPYRNLLEPRIGGIGQVLYALGDELDALVDVTIVFPARGSVAPPTLWQVLSGQVTRVVVRARQVPIPAALRGRNFRTDPDFRRELEGWVTQLWRDKDQLLTVLNQQDRAVD
jgi:1-acyl-sn-glycerol-3-phosphate acyltransferase